MKMATPVLTNIFYGNKMRTPYIIHYADELRREHFLGSFKNTHVILVIKFSIFMIDSPDSLIFHMFMP